MPSNMTFGLVSEDKAKHKTINYLLVPSDMPSNRRYDQSPVKINAKGLQDLRSKVWKAYHPYDFKRPGDWAWANHLEIYGPEGKNGQRRKKIGTISIIIGRDVSFWYYSATIPNPAYRFGKDGALISNLDHKPRKGQVYDPKDWGY